MREKNKRPDRAPVTNNSRKPPSKSSSSKKGGGTSKPSKKNDPPRTPLKEADEEDIHEKARQQALLDVFSSTFGSVLSAPDFTAQLQQLKAALFRRDFEEAFRNEAALDVYAARWSPTRAMCYGRIFRQIDGHLRPPRRRLDTAKGREGNESERGIVSEIQDELANVELGEQSGSSSNVSGHEDHDTLRVLAIGGAAAEIVAFADYVADSGIRADITLLDVGPWESVVHRLRAVLESDPTSEDGNKSALIKASDFHVDFVQKDVLSLDKEYLTKLLILNDQDRNNSAGEPDVTTNAGNDPPRRLDNPNPVLITLLFTLNELYTAGGIKLTTSFLRFLTDTVAPGTLLLVVDSPGSYSEAAIGKEAKKYPMQWLLDHTILSVSAKEAQTVPDRDKPETVGCKWEKIESCDSAWFRLSEGLRYPIQLENMRYQLHLYRYGPSSKGAGT
ncbi:hypothetical protein GGS20DRAFT_208624 [Poronia punctata]|nr:hypothetical protein GGS20DRAFT_208624 [Poronia punctata]